MTRPEPRLPGSVCPLNWWRRWRLVRAYAFLRDTAQEHMDAQHVVEFVAINETHMRIRCYTCHPVRTP